MTQYIDRTEREHSFIIELPEVHSVLYITPDYQIHSSRKYPNLWYRFWYHVLLGWRWEKKDA